MGIKQVIVDDIDGTDLPEGTEPVDVTYDGKTYPVYLSDSNKERFVNFLNGTAPLSKKTAPKTSTGSGSTGKKTETYGYNYADVKAWAIANKKTGKGGGKITPDTKVLHQGIYDDYKKFMDSEDS